MTPSACPSEPGSALCASSALPCNCQGGGSFGFGIVPTSWGSISECVLCSLPCFHLLCAAVLSWSSVSSDKQPHETVASLHGYLERSFLSLEEAVLQGLSGFLSSFTLQSCFPWHHSYQSPKYVRVFSSGVRWPGLCCWLYSLPFGIRDPTISWSWPPRLMLVLTSLTSSSLSVRTRSR